MYDYDDDHDQMNLLSLLPLSPFRISQESDFLIKKLKPQTYFPIPPNRIFTTAADGLVLIF